VYRHKSTPQAQVLAAALALATALFPAELPAPGHDGFTTHDLHQDGKLSRERHLPVLLLFSADYCTFCVRLIEEFLQPMRISGEYDDKVLIREIKIDSHRPMRDFQNRAVSPEDLAYRYNISVTPTVLFVDAHGRELTQRMVGLGTVEFYGLYLDDAIEKALSRLRQEAS